MPSRDVVTKELSKLFNVLSHPHRIQIVEELRKDELDVKALEEELGISHSRVSQHLSLLRNHDVVKSRREGRHVFYSLVDPELARWLLEGLEFVVGRLNKGRELRAAVEEVRHMWSDE
jgi:DNA-binding transcriptional ArsR family regulator